MRNSTPHPARALALALVVATVLAVALGAATPRPARATPWTWGDTLTTILRPLPNLPALVRPGVDTLVVWAAGPPSITGWNATLSYGTMVPPPVFPAGGGFNAATNRWELRFTVPQIVGLGYGGGVPELTYDLVLTSDQTAPDTSRHAVALLPYFETDYYFAQISRHAPAVAHTFSSDAGFSTADTSGFADYNAVVEDLNLIHPEFIIHTGDLVNEGELEDYLGMYEMSRAKEALSRLRAPGVGVDGQSRHRRLEADAAARRHVAQAVVEAVRLAVPRQSTRRRPVSLAGLLVRLRAAARDRARGLHQQRLVRFVQHGAVRRAELHARANELARRQHRGACPRVTRSCCSITTTSAARSGTDRRVRTSRRSTRPRSASTAPSGATTTWSPEGNRTAKPFNLGLQSVIDYRAFRLFRVSNGVITPGPMHHSGGIAAAPTDSIVVGWNAANDGTAQSITATVFNRFGEGFEHCRLVFHMQPGFASYQATGGTVVQEYDNAGMHDVEVEFAAPPSTNTQVSVNASVGAVIPPLTLAAGVSLASPAPNPWLRGAGGGLAVTFALPAQAPDVDLAIYDVSGRRVATLAQGTLAAGPHTAHWDGVALAGGSVRPGVYFVRLAALGGVRTSRVAIVE